MCGHEYKRKLMVVGRATNGWTHSFRRQQLLAPRGPERWAQRAREDSEDDECPMLWVARCWGARKGYNTKGSAFWRVSGTVASELLGIELSDLQWPSQMAWSNLYKVAPAARKNPGNRLCRVQLETTAELLRREVAELKPKRVLVLAGGDWFEDFEKPLGLDVSWTKGLIEGVAESRGTRWVIGPHPQGKKERPLVRAIRNAFDT